MKKLLVIAMIAVGFTANAQEEKTISSYKPNQGDVTASFSLVGGISSGTSYGLRNGQLRGRYFSTSDFAYRGGLNLSSQNESSDDKNSEGSTAIDLAFGIEKHLNGTTRLSPYYGGEVFVGYSKQSKTSGGNDVDYDGKTRFGVAGVIGADYYFVQNVFLGVEASWGLGFSTQGDTSNFNLGNGTAGIKLGFVF